MKKCAMILDPLVCPYYRPHSVGCHLSTCELHKEKEKKVMEEFHYVALVGSQASPQFKTENDAINWAKAQMEKKIAIERIYTYSSLSVIERDSPPLKVRHVPKTIRSEEQPTGTVRKDFPGHGPTGE